MASYNSLLKDYPDKGVVGRTEIHDKPEDVKSKVEKLATLWQNAKHVMVITGAGISTAAGVPDFRGPNGVWTLEKQGKPCHEISLKNIRPTFAHQALVEMEKKGLISFLLSQNIDNLHLKSGFPRKKIAEVHGNLFMGVCMLCGREYIYDEPILSVGLKKTVMKCEGKPNGRPCRGFIRDNCLDWDDQLPQHELTASEKNLKACDLLVVLGSSLEIVPVGKMPLRAQKDGKTVVTVNLQPTKYEKDIGIKIHAKIDDVFKKLVRLLEVEFEFENREVPLELADVTDPQKDLATCSKVSNNGETDQNDHFESDSASNNRKRRREPTRSTKSIKKSEVQPIVENGYESEFEPLEVDDDEDRKKKLEEVRRILLATLPSMRSEPSEAMRAVTSQINAMLHQAQSQQGQNLMHESFFRSTMVVSHSHQVTGKPNPQ